MSARLLLLARFAWGALLAILFVRTWTALWGLAPGTPAADEITVPDEARWSLAMALARAAHVTSQFQAETLPIRSRDLGRLREVSYDSDNLVPLTPCDSLETLDLELGQPHVQGMNQGDHVLDVAPLDSLSHLSALMLGPGTIGSMRHLDRLTPLRVLRLANNPINDLRQIGQLSQLTELDLSYSLPPGHYGYPRCDIPNAANSPPLNITPLAALTNLQQLNLSRRGLNSITPLLTLTHLTRLGLSQNHLTSIAGIEQLQSLEQVDLAQNQIADFSPLERLPHLRAVQVGSNPVSRERALPVLTSLKARGVLVDYTPARKPPTGSRQKRLPNPHP